MLWTVSSLLTLKKVAKTCEVEPANRIKDKKVLNPPLSTAGPIFCNAIWDLCWLEPAKCKQNLKWIHTSKLKGDYGSFHST